MTDQPALFDPARLVPTACPVPHCQALRYPEQHKTPTCAHDRDRALGNFSRRPRGCLNTPQPEHQEIPY